MDLLDRTVVITGAAKRVGRAIALELSRAGCDVAIHCYASGEAAESLGQEIRETGRRCCVIRADLSDMAQWRRVVDEAVDNLGPPAMLINNASVFGSMTLDEFDPIAWEHTFRINLTAAAGLSHFAAPHLRRQKGKIVNLTDISADRPWSGHLAYCASKAGLIALTRSLAKSLAPDVQVNAVSPGIAVFPDEYDDQTRTDLIAKVPLKRPGTPEDVARTVRFLCEQGDYITGQVIKVDGGRSIA